MNRSTSPAPSTNTGGPNVAIQVYLNTLKDKIAKLQKEINKKDKLIQNLRLGKAIASQSEPSETDEPSKKEVELQTALAEVEILTGELKEHREKVKSNVKEISSLRESLTKAEQD